MVNMNKNKHTLSAADLMPTGELAEKILRDRSHQLARGDESDSAKSQSLIDYICIRVSKNEQYGIPYHFAKEVKVDCPITAVPNTLDFVAGVINWRGHLLSILDLKRYFQLEHHQERQNTFIIIVAAAGMTAGLLVDSIDGQATYDQASLLAPWSSGTNIKPDYLYGLHQGKVGIINIKNILVDAKARLSSKEE